MPVTQDDLKAVLGDVDNDKALQILALDPTPAELEEAAIWAAGDGDVLAKSGKPLSGKAAEIWTFSPPTRRSRRRASARFVPRRIECKIDRE
jgi:hypothetical protein